MKHNRIYERIIISGYVELLKRKLLMVCPYEEKHLLYLVKKIFREVSWISVLMTVALYFWNGFFDGKAYFYIAGSILLANYIVFTEVPNYKVQEKETACFQELLVYFSRVKHRYQSCHHIPNSIFDAAEGMSYEIRQHAMVLYRILMESGRKEIIREYVRNTTGNKYLKLFLIQAYEASENGDTPLPGGTSLFSENMEHLRLELMDEIYRRKRRAYEFAGYTFVTVTPVFMMPVLKQWGLDFAPELASFYLETGKVIELITFFATVVLYGLINRAKEITLSGKVFEQENDLLEWMWKIPLLRRVEEKFEEQSSRFSRKMRELLLQSGSRSSYGRFMLKMLAGVMLTAVLLMVLFSDVLICVGGGVIAGMVPFIRVWYQLQTLEMDSLYEIKQFQSVAIMERNLKGITILGILEDMEIFSVRFHAILRTCINSYSSGPMQALQKMKEEGEKLHSGFSELADAFLSVDDVGITAALAEVDNNRMMMEKMTQLEANIRLEKKKDSTDLLSKIPLVLTVGVYFIVPFFLYSLQGVFEIFQLLEEL